jgi:hypothetical protein
VEFRTKNKQTKIHEITIGTVFLGRGTHEAGEVDKGV